MKSLAMLLREDAEAIIDHLRTLLDMSGIVVRGEETIAGFVVVSPYGNNVWASLSTEGRRVQARVNELYREFNERLDLLLDGAIEDLRCSHHGEMTFVLSVIQQHHCTSNIHVSEYTDAVEAAVRRQVALISNLYSGAEEPVFVPDTNALLYNLDLGAWNVLRPEGVTIVLVPTVLAELDKLKVSATAEKFRDKVDSAIRRIKGYRVQGGGSLKESVKVAGKVFIKSIAAEPQGKTLPWLRPQESLDDRLLASALEIMAKNPRAPVVLVTRDVNLQNKCDHARLPFVEPPDPLLAQGV